MQYKSMKKLSLKAIKVAKSFTSEKIDRILGLDSYQRLCQSSLYVSESYLALP
jgi:hypothetical protein